MNELEKVVYDKIINNQDYITIFGLSYCMYTQQALALVKKYNLKFKYYSVDKYHSKFINVIRNISNYDSSINIDVNHTTFPIIFIKSKFIGGFDKLNKIYT